MKLLICFICLFPGFSLAHSLHVKLKELKHERGMILYLLFDKKDGFPSDAQRSFRQGEVKASEKLIVISDLPAGSYALSVIHDENNNKKLDTMLGIPKEGFGFSNNPRIYFGPPDFEDAMINLESDLAIKVRLKSL